MSTWVSAEAEWEPILRRDAAAYFAGGDGLPERRATPGRIEHFSYRPAPDRPRLFVRRYRHGGLISFLGGCCIGRGRLEREMSLLRTLRDRGLNVPRVAGGVDAGELALVTEEIEGAVTLLEWLRAPRRDGWRAVARAVRGLADAGVAHPDLNVRNILIRGDEVWFVDFDRAAFGDASGLVPRLNRSLEKWLPPDYSVSRSDRWRFLTEFAGGSDAARALAPACAAGLGFHRWRWKIFGT